MKKRLVFLVAISAFLSFSQCVQAQSVTPFLNSSNGINNPTGLTMDASGNFFMINYQPGNYPAIYKSTTNGIVSFYWADLQLYPHSAVAVDSVGNVYFASSVSNSRGQIFGLDKSRTLFGVTNEINTPTSLAFDSHGVLYVTTGGIGINYLYKINDDGSLAILDSAKDSYGGIAIDKKDNIYVSCINTGVVKKIDNKKTVTLFASVSNPTCMAFDPKGNLYVVSDTNTPPFGVTIRSLKQIDTSGSVKTAYTFNNYIDIGSIIFDSNGIMYFSNQGYNEIDKMIFNNLPVTLANLTAISTKGSIITNWQTATELNTSHFAVQRSTDGTNFSLVGTVKAKGSSANSYSFTDSKPVEGTNYYRLQSVDKNGAFTYSKVVSVQFTVNRLPFTVAPNPAQSTVTINGSHIAYLQIVNALGKTEASQTLTDATNPSVAVSSLASGVYYVTIKTTDGSVSTLKMIKQ